MRVDFPRQNRQMHFMKWCSFAGLGAGLAMLVSMGCPSGSSPPSTAGAANTTQTSVPDPVPPPTPPPSTVSVKGTWKSASCGERTYARELTLSDDAVSGRDLVSPCAPNTRCVWSGIVEWSGTYTLEGERVVLNVPPPKHAVVLPAELILKDGVLHEGSCAYERGAP